MTSASRGSRSAARRIAQPAEEAGEARPVLAAAPVAPWPFRTHHVVDPPVEEGARSRPCPRCRRRARRQGRGVDRAQRQPLGVVVVVGRGIAGEPPHEVGAAPADAQRAQRRFCGMARIASAGAALRAPGPWPRAGTRPARGCARGSSSPRAARAGKRAGHRRVDRLDPGVDHAPPRPWGRRAAPGAGSIAELGGGAVDRARSSRRTRHFRRPASARRTRICSSGVSSAMPPQLALCGRARASATSTSATAIATAPTQSSSGQPLAIIRASRAAPSAGWVSSASPTTSGGTAERVDQQPLADDLAARARAANRRPVGGDDLLAGDERDRQQHRSRRTGWRGTARAAARPRRGRVRRRSDSRRRAARRAARAGRRAGGGLTVRRCRPSAAPRRPRPAQRERLHRDRPAAAPATGPRRRNEAGDVAEQGRIAELGHQDAGVPGGKVGGEEESGDERSRQVIGRARPMRTGWLTAIARPATGTGAPAPAARSPRRPARRRRGAPATARSERDIAEQQAPRRQAVWDGLVLSRPLECERRPVRGAPYVRRSATADRAGRARRGQRRRPCRLAPGRRGRSPAPHSRPSGCHCRWQGRQASEP